MNKWEDGTVDIDGLVITLTNKRNINVCAVRRLVVRMACSVSKVGVACLYIYIQSMSEVKLQSPTMNIIVMNTYCFALI